jgi:hypothetical protein
MRKHRSKYRKMTKKTRRRIVLGIIGAAALAFLIFWGMFYITDVEVVGNTRYTETEVEEMALGGFFGRNSFLLSTFRSHIDLEDVPFMESVDVEYLDRNRVRLHVNEKQPVGYVLQDSMEYYFDKDGLVLEAMAAEEEDAADSGSALQPDAPAGTDGEAGADTGNGATVITADPVTPEAQETQQGGYRPALTDVPLVRGLVFDHIRVGEEIPVEDPSVFNTIHALTRMIDRYEIQPDYVEVGGQQTLSLQYGGVRIELGSDSLLEEKMTRVAAILPRLSGMSGTLHLEDFTEDTQNIIFDTEEVQNTEPQEPEEENTPES